MPQKAFGVREKILNTKTVARRTDLHREACGHRSLRHRRKTRPGITSYYKACTKYFPALLATTKLAQSTSQYCFALQSLHKILPGTTLYYEACTKYFPVLLRTTKLVQNTSQYYFVLQNLHKVLPSTTAYYKVCTNYFPVQLRTKKLAQNTSQYYSVLHSLHKVLPSTTLYYKACTKHFPVLLCAAKLAQSTSRYYLVLHRLQSQFYFLLHDAHTVHPSTTAYYKACTEKVLHKKKSHGELLHRGNFTHRRIFYTEKPLHREAFTQSTQKAMGNQPTIAEMDQ